MINQEINSCPLCKTEDCRRWKAEQMMSLLPDWKQRSLDEECEFSANRCPECNGKCCRDTDYGYRVLHMGAESYEHLCDHCQEGTVPKNSDDPIWDGTDSAHPAWWRGSDAGVDGAVYEINKILDDIEARKEPSGVCGSKKMSMLRDRLYQMFSR